MAGRQLSHRNEGSSTISPARAWFPERLSAALAAGLLAFVCYWHTLLPGLDFGDTAAFQTGVGSMSLTPRQAYPLYYGLGNVVAWLDPHEPAHAMNLASAIYGSLAVAVTVLVAADIAGSLVGGVSAGLLLGFSYTFWTQAIIAEVYTLHLLIVALCLMALLAWEKTPTLRRLALFYAVFALGFGNHLSTVLLLPGFAVFILMVRPREGPENPLRPAAVALAIGIACTGALQYSWNFRGLWLAGAPPSGLADALGRFWFDVTKADWRQTLVMNVSEAGLHNRPALYWFDLHQQFGTPGAFLAIAGFAGVAARRPRIGALLLLLYIANLLFAWTYNVGDVHVFFLPSHYILALCAGAGVTEIARLFRRSRVNKVPDLVYAGVAAVCLLYICWRGYDTYPAVDRSLDHRPEQVLRAFTAPAGTSAAERQDLIFGVDANWQVQNAFEYFMKRERPGVAWFTADDLPWLRTMDAGEKFRRFIEANRRAGRGVVMTPDFGAKLTALGMPLHLQDLDRSSGAPSRENIFASQLAELHPRTIYALGILRPNRESPLDMAELTAAWAALTGAAAPLPALANYTIVLGEVGRPPLVVDSRDRPFRIRQAIDTADFDVRMESWLPTDTIRRAGFGQVIVNRRHVLILERGVSFVALDARRQPAMVLYRSGIFAPLPRLTFPLCNAIPCPM